MNDSHISGSGDLRCIYNQTPNSCCSVTGEDLVRSKLDAHPRVGCRLESRITSKVLRLWRIFGGATNRRAVQAGIAPYAIINATKAFLEDIIRLGGPDANVLCYKDPATFRYLELLGRMFPNAKFIHMVRDGRAVMASSFNETGETGDNLKVWQLVVSRLIRECAAIGSSRCINVRYETLVMHTEREMRRISEKLLKNISLVNRSYVLLNV
ncbi:unnamed protein product [Echinostoma caproni]|uniref:Protein-tyrosine sulfotransferase n=1 Tax=Echinostoma caproni TaxID=27848 RepID=A0A183A565_9TREM|nr:unnamed protein product [Echinostoma caproni]